MDRLKKIIKIEEPAAAKYPQSKELFQLVKKVIMTALEVNDSDRLNDIEIGKLVGYNYDETSRWKHGRIKVDNAERLMTLQEKLDIDEYLLLRVASGRISSEQAFDIWKLGYKLKDRYKKEKLYDYLKSKKIDFKLVIMKGEESSS